MAKFAIVDSEKIGKDVAYEPPLVIVADRPPDPLGGQRNCEIRRVRDEGVNLLTVVANEAYSDYARGLQQEYVADGTMPALAQLKTQGAMAQYALSVDPSLTAAAHASSCPSVVEPAGPVDGCRDRMVPRSARAVDDRRDRRDGPDGHGRPVG